MQDVDRVAVAVFGDAPPHGAAGQPPIQVAQRQAVQPLVQRRRGREAQVVAVPGLARRSPSACRPGVGHGGASCSAASSASSEPPSSSLSVCSAARARCSYQSSRWSRAIAVLGRARARLGDDEREVAADAVAARHQHAEPPARVDDARRPGEAQHRRGQVDVEPALAELLAAVAHRRRQPAVERARTALRACAAARSRRATRACRTRPRPR